MKVQEENSVEWTELGDELECELNDQGFDESFDGSITVRLRVDEVLEEFENRRVLVASASEIVDAVEGGDLDDEVRNAILLPTYLIEECSRFIEVDRDRAEELCELVRAPIAVSTNGGIRRSFFVDNIGVSVGDLVDLVRGELKLHQIEAVFGAVGELLEDLHEAGWVHLGLTPWNVRVFGAGNSDAFLQVFLTEAMSQKDPLFSPEEQGEEDLDLFGREQTLVEVQPLGTKSSKGEEAEDDDPQSEAGDDGEVAAGAEDEEAAQAGDLAEDAEDRDDSEISEEVEEQEDKESQGEVEEGESDATDEADEEVDGDEPDATTDGVSADAPEKASDDEDDQSDESQVLVDRAGAGLAGSALHGSEASWSDAVHESSVSISEGPPEALSAILDGIDRLYPAGRVKDEVAVTPGFSAPELLSGLGTRDGESADVFSLGMFLYFLVAGVVPPASVYTRYGPALPARNFRPEFPPGLQAVISRATRPRPEDRYASVATLMEAFHDACDVMRKRARPLPGGPPALRVASDTHIGIAKRRSNPTNQDSVFSASSDDGRFALIVVADGVSTASYGSGDLASSALTEEAAKVWADVLPTYLMEEEIDEFEVIDEILGRANEQIVKHVNEHHTPFRGSPHEVMGSTALVALIVDGTVTLAALGDSRVYLQRGAGMEQITIDHNLWTLSILDGVQADAALSMPHGDALARCLGTFVVEDARLSKVDPRPDLFRFDITEGDTLLLTTDGLVDFAGTNLLAAEDNILAILLAEPDPDLACLELILLANRGGGGDNIGLSVVRVS